MKLNALKLTLLAATILATGCASTAKGAKESVLSKNTAEQNLKAKAPRGGLLAVIRYPAVVDESAKDKYREAYTNAPIGGSISAAVADSSDARNMADSTIVKSSYFALSLYKELVARLPEHSVLLSPHTVELGPDGQLTSSPITQAESLPSVVTIDFATYSFPNPKKMMNSEPLTFGDLVTPLVVVRTDHQASVPTQGVLLASTPLRSYAAGNGHKTAKQTMANFQSGRLEHAIPELDFIAYLSKDETKSVARQGISLNASQNAVQSYPVEKLKMSSTALASLNTDKKGAVDPLRPAFSKDFANRIINIINDTPSEKAAMVKRASAIADYDPSLAALTFVGSPDSDYVARYNYAERLLDAEKKYLSVQSLRLFDGVHNGEMGAQVRDMLQAEYEILRKRRKLAKKQNQATALAILSAVAAGATMASSGPDCSTARTNQEYYNCQRRAQNQYRTRQVASDILISSAVYAGTQAFAYKNESKAVGSNYLTSIVPALEQQTTVQVDLIDSNETITAIRFDDLKSKLQTLYAQKQRSLETVATQCGYMHDGAAKTGSWLGVCENGLASGTGVGVFKTADGKSIEYYGYARNGQPNGPGFLVSHAPAGSYAMEGNFANGKAHGVMRVSKSGSSDRIRKYDMGQDRGSAPSGSRPASPFKMTPGTI